MPRVSGKFPESWCAWVLEHWPAVYNHAGVVCLVLAFGFPLGMTCNYSPAHDIAQAM